MLSPVAFFTLMLLVGALGFVPFGTSYVFFRQCYIAFKQAQEHAQRGVLVMLFVLGVIMAAAPPAYQYTLHQTLSSKAFALLVVDDEAKRKEAVQILRKHVYWADLDQMVVMYRDAPSQRVKERLWRAYFDITGKDLTARLNAMFD